MKLWAKSVFCGVVALTLSSCIKLESTGYQGETHLDPVAAVANARGILSDVEIAFLIYQAQISSMMPANGSSNQQLVDLLSAFPVDPVSVISAIDAVIASVSGKVDPADYNLLLSLRAYFAGDTIGGNSVVKQSAIPGLPVPRKAVFMIGSSISKILDDIEDVDPADQVAMGDLMVQVTTFIDNLKKLQDLLLKMQMSLVPPAS